MIVKHNINQLIAHYANICHLLISKPAILLANCVIKKYFDSSILKKTRKQKWKQERAKYQIASSANFNKKSSWCCLFLNAPELLMTCYVNFIKNIQIFWCFSLIAQKNLKIEFSLYFDFAESTGSPQRPLIRGNRFKFLKNLTSPYKRYTTLEISFCSDLG